MELNNEDRLLKVLGNVNDWLKFAESKNAMLIAFNGASIYGAARLFDLSLIKNSSFLSVYLFVVIVFFIFSAILGLISFIPRVKILPIDFTNDANANSLFYEHLKGRSQIEIIQDICETSGTEFRRFEIDIANQIQQNSDITSRKLSYFTIAIWLTVIGYLTLPLAAIFFIYTYAQNKIPE